MGPKFDPAAVYEIMIRVTGGEVPGGSSLAPKIGPLGLSPKKVGDDIAKATGEWKGMRVTVKLTVQNRNAKIDVIPSASSLVIKALKEPPRDRKKQKNIKHDGNVSLDEIYKIARIMRPRSLAKTFDGTVKEILGKEQIKSYLVFILSIIEIFLGTAQSVGCKVEGSHPHDIINQISNGQVDVPRE
ncbi:unnamed protein product [Adineta steineri]|uniref:60S ribosomal protein L12 n=1 Tax=Adineta steineri TaxID=433720 RepID=A0A813S8U9_9BILA|nr:unnamed protein product [Adineta steineri]CAF0853025.1 unnamed protein product [Adineta steineri]CAF3682881.1 unnamed protein product [Adineta steineri]CAF3816305.1 unnamed protein product [Adineta steineri]